MAVDVAPLAPPDSKPIYRLIRRTRRLLRLTWTVTGLALTLGLFLGAAAVVLAADLLLPLVQLPFYIAYPLDSGLRLAALVLVAVPPAAAFLVGVVFPLFRRLTAGRVARRIEAQIPGIHNRLVSCIDLEQRGRAAASPVFYRRLLTESLERIRGFRPRRVLDFVNLRRAGMIAVAGTAAFALVAFLFWGQLPTAMARILHPFDDIPPVAGVAYEVQPGPGAHHFLREDKIDFVAEVKRGEVGSLHLQLQADNGAVREFDLEPTPDDPSTLRRTLDSASIGPAFLNGFHYRVYGGGTWSQRYALPLAERPLIKAVDTAVFYPAYMGIPEPHPTPAEASEIIGPEGGDIEVSVLAEGNVAVGELQPLKVGTAKIAARDQIERVWFEDTIPDGASDGGTWQHVKKDKHSAHTEPYAMGPHGHWFQNDQTGFVVQPSEVLFAYVNIDPQAAPDEIMLQWNDGKTWDHGAYWGVDLIREGKSGTPSRCPVDKLPHAGSWARLEVPAAKVGLEGKTLHGMAFKLSGGQCWWGKSGAVRVEQPTFVPDETLQPFPMKSDGSGRWVGRVPLLGKGQFRPQLRNEQGDANTDVQELHYSAIKDQPPQVVLQRPGAELPLSKPQATPLTILAFDDYGLADVTVFYREDVNQPFQSRVLRHFDQPERSQTVVASLTETEALKPGAPLHYYVQVSDRKGQTARTPDAVVYLKDDANAADKQEEAFDKTQDTFRDRLLKMIAEQKKVQTQVEKLTGQYAEMTEKIRKDQEAAPQPPAATDPTKPQPPAPPKTTPNLDPETAKKLADLEKELAKLGQDQDKNAQSASQLNNDLTKANEQAANLQTLPQPVVDQMHALQQAFEQTAVKAMQNLTQDFNQGANPRAGAPDLKDINQKSDRLAKDLEGIKDRMEALENARKGLRDDLAKAIQELQREMLNENGKLSERDLQELRDFIARMRDQLKDLQGKQEDLLNNSEKGGDLKDLETKQADLDKQLEKMLDAARKMLDAKRNRRKPEFPDAPYTPDGDEVKVPPKEDDTNEPLPNAKKPGDKTNPGDKKPDDMKDDDDKEPLDMPALGGPKQVPDKRFDKKKRPTEKKPGDKDDPDAKRDDLESHQNDRLRDLDAAEKSLASDQKSLEQMMQALEQAVKNNGGQKPHKPSQNPGDPADDAMQQLADMMQSPAMRQMRDMLNRMRRQGQAKGRPSNQPPTPSQSPSSQAGNNPPVGSADLSKLSPDLRAAFLKLPPRMREELLQGQKEQDPEGFGPFIEDYFKRLTQTKNP